MVLKGWQSTAAGREEMHTKVHMASPHLIATIHPPGPATHSINYATSHCVYVCVLFFPHVSDRQSFICQRGDQLPLTADQPGDNGRL